MMSTKAASARSATQLMASTWASSVSASGSAFGCAAAAAASEMKRVITSGGTSGNFQTSRKASPMFLLALPPWRATWEEREFSRKEFHCGFQPGSSSGDSAGSRPRAMKRKNPEQDRKAKRK